MTDWDSFDALREQGHTYGMIAEALAMNVNTLRRQAYERRKARAPHPHPQFGTPPPDEPTLEDLFALARHSQRVLNQLDPILTHQSIRLETTRPVGILFTSCAHLGSRYTFYEEFQRLFEEALQIDRLYWVSLGNDVEGFLPSFRDASAVLDQAIANPKVQRRMLAAVLDRLASAGRLLCGCASQHGGDWARKVSGDDPIKAMYQARGIPFFDGKALIRLEVGNQTYHLALAHEFPGHSIYNKNHAQRRAALFDFPSADVIVQGDKHCYAVQEMSLPPFEYDAGLRSGYTQWFVQVGTAKVGLDKYSVRGWSRGVLEWPVMVFRPDRHFIAHARDMNLARLLLEQW